VVGRHQLEAEKPRLISTFVDPEGKHLYAPRRPAAREQAHENALIK